MINPKDTVQEALLKAKAKRVYLEGNLVKILSKQFPAEVKEYIEECKTKDKQARKKRLDVTKQVQSQNKELAQAAEDNEKLMADLQVALKEAENLRDEAVEDLDMMQKRTQFELIGLIVRVALIVIVGVGITTTILYTAAIMMDKDTTLLGNAWSNLFGILLTNSFSIIGTIMGVKYATEKK
jgi:hypothetical protein